MPHPLLMDPFFIVSSVLLISGALDWIGDRVVKSRTRPHAGERVMVRFLSYFLGEYEWFRRWHGGKWARVHIDHPVCSTLWLPIPASAGPDYREGLWRGTPEFRNYDRTRTEGETE